jgi:UDP-glucose 4-epimerase
MVGKQNPQDTNMSKVLVTGGCGFIGSHLVELLLEHGHQVIVVDNLSRGNKLPQNTLSRIQLLEADVRAADVVRAAACGCQYIFHLAAVLGVDIVADKPVETMETEMVGMKNVVDAAVHHGVEKVIYASTSGVYGHSAIEKAVSETIQLDPRTSYAIAKRFNEIYLSAVFEEKGLTSASLRFFNVYGPRQDTRMVIPRFLKQALHGEPITVYGSGRQTRDFTYVDDAVKASLLVARQVRGCEVFNVASEKEHTIMELAQAIKDLTGAASPIVSLEAPKKRYDFEVERRVGHSEKLARLTGFRPNTPLKEGLAKVLKASQVVAKDKTRLQRTTGAGSGTSES